MEDLLIDPTFQVDETQPLLSGINKPHYQNVTDQKLVDFDLDGDSENPMDWTKSYKLGIVTLLSFMAFTV